MNLLYVWNDNYSDYQEKVGYLLTSKYDIRFDKLKNELSISLDSQYISGFWGNNILDVVAIVGENGSGKTMLANYIMNILRELEGTNYFSFEFFIVFEDEDDEKIKIYVSNKYKNIKVDCPNYSYEIKTENPFDEFMLYKVAYFTNALSLNDYRQRKYGYVYDASVGGLMRNSFQEKYEMHYIDESKNIIFNYYETEIDKMIYFLYSDIDKMDIPFKVPKYFVIKLNNYTVNEKYINNELSKAREHNKQLQKLMGNFEISFIKYLDNIMGCYGKSWINSLIINLIMNLFKEMCLPRTSGDNKSEEIIGFISELQAFEKKNISQSTDIFELVIQLLDNINKKVKGSSYYIGKYRDFILWIFTNRAIFEENSNVMNWECTLELDEGNKETIVQLLYFYNNTNFPYSYFSFDFGLSTGEFNFLNMFANIHIALSTNNATATGSIRCTNFLLFFDEADLSLHPKWQQRYVDWITRFVSSCVQEGKVQIFIATHSPIMLSDFPRNNVLYLCKQKAVSHLEPQRNINTFGNNIHTLFLDSFFLNDSGTMGAFAEKKINEILKLLRSKEKIIDEDKTILKIINLIGDDLIKDKLLELYEKNQGIRHELQENVNEYAAIDNSIAVLQNQINELQRTIEQLEQMKND